jgi:NIMA-interacting peptidyl-prolyl cis-trans isomerase 1
MRRSVPVACTVGVVGLSVLLLASGCDKSSGDAAPLASAASASATPSAIPSAGATPAASATPSVAAAAPDTIIAQHILVIYKGAKRAPKTITRSKPEAKARAAEALAKIKAGAAFEDVVKDYSDDAGSVDRMGSLGKFHRDDMDPAFSAAAFALQPGQVSDIVETPFGFHVIKRTQ